MKVERSDDGTYYIKGMAKESPIFYTSTDAEDYMTAMSTPDRLTKLERIIVNVAGSDPSDEYRRQEAKQDIKDLIIELLEDCKHTINTDDENSWVSWDQVSEKVHEL